MLAWRNLRLPASARPSSSLAAVARRSFPPGARLSSDSDFRLLRAPNAIYIDKSRHIETFLNYRHALHVIKRPRRCGKTTLLSLFRYFFILDPSTQDERAAMFSGLDIKEKYPLSWNSHFGKYPVLYLNFNNLDITNCNTFRSSLAFYVREAATKFFELGYFKNLASSRDVGLKSLMNMQADGPDLLQSLWLICHLTAMSTGIKPVVLIDEYNSPIAHAAEEGNLDVLKQITADMRMLMTTLFKTEPEVAISRALLAGVSQMPESGSYTSGLNNLQIFGVDHAEYAEACHFTATDVEELFHHYMANVYDKPVLFDLARLQGRCHAYCTPSPSLTPLCIPFAVTRALNQGKVIHPPETPSGGDKLLQNMLLQLSKTDPITLDNFLRLIHNLNETIAFTYCPAVLDHRHPVTANEFWSIMLDSGYIAPADEPHTFKIPNPDIAEVLSLWGFRIIQSYLPPNLRIR